MPLWRSHPDPMLGRGFVRCNPVVSAINHTSKEDDRERREGQVIQDNERVLVQVGGIETGSTRSAFAAENGGDTCLLNGKNQNIANTQMTFYRPVSACGAGSCRWNTPCRRSYCASLRYVGTTIAREPKGVLSGTGTAQTRNPRT